jgi:protoheme IX farnesyltransferase
MSTSTVAISRRAAVLGRAADYIELTRPKIALLIVATVAAAQYAAGGTFSATAMLAAMAGVLLVAASASALNQWLERKTDALMARTCDRPAPTGRLGAVEVHLFALAAFAAGEAWLVVFAGWGAALWAAATWAAYVWCYTPLKSRTWFNTVVGAAAGAMPVFIGAAAGRSAADPLTDPIALSLFGLVLFWQFPHFMAIAWIYRQDYADAGLQMLTVTDPSGRRAGQLAVGAAAAVVLVSAAPALVAGLEAGSRPIGWAAAGWLAAALLGFAQLGCAVAFCVRKDDRSARRLLHASLVYLPAMLGLLLFLA